MAELNFEYTTTYKAGDKIEITFTWKRIRGTSTYFDAYDSNGNYKSINIENLGYTSGTKEVIVVSGMEISGSGDMYDSTDDFVFKSSTDSDTNSNGENYSYPKLNYDWNDIYNRPRFFGIEEIICSSAITSFADGLFYRLYNSGDNYTRSYVCAKELSTPISLVRTGRANILNENSYEMFGKHFIYDVKLDCTNLKIAGYCTFVDGVSIVGKFNSGLEVIHSYAFDYFSAFQLDIGRRIKYIGDKAFYECPNLISFNDGNYLSGEALGTPLYDCPCIKLLTINDNLIHNDTKPFIYITKGTGNNLYDGTDGKYKDFQMVEVITNKREFLEYYYDDDLWMYVGTKWEDGYIYVGAVIEEGEEFWCFQAGRTPADIIRIKAYDSGDREVQCGNKIKYIRYVELTDAKASPIHTFKNGRIVALSY